MSRQTEAAWELLRISNDHALAQRFGATAGRGGTQTPYIRYIAGTSGRASHGPMWAVWRPGFTLGSSYPTYGARHFHVMSIASRARSLEAAQRDCAERYGIQSWARSPFGGYHPAHVVESFTEALKAAQKASSS